MQRIGKLARRDLLAMMAAGAVLGPTTALRAALPPASRIAFDVLREDSTIGRHVIGFREEGRDLLVDIDIDLEVRFAFLTLFRYQHRNRERWRDGRLISLDSQTDDDGSPYWVKAQAVENGLQVESSEARFIAPAETLPTSYWNPATVRQRRLLDSQRGRLLDVEIKPSGRSRVVLPQGIIEAQRYRVDGDLKLDIWYGPDQAWVKLAFEAKGTEIEYSPLETTSPQRT